MCIDIKYQIFSLLFVTLCSVLVIHGQRQADTLIQIKGAVQMAEQRYHLLKSRQYESDAATKAIDIVKYSKLPTVDASYQAGAGTANNLTGIFYPYGILPMTGPPSGVNNYTPVTGSAASVLLNWQAVTFGQRGAQIDVAIAEANTKKSVFRQSPKPLSLNTQKVKLYQCKADPISIQSIHKLGRA